VTSSFIAHWLEPAYILLRHAAWICNIFTHYLRQMQLQCLQTGHDRLLAALLNSLFPLMYSKNAHIIFGVAISLTYIYNF
jgi:hypothetical protein